MLGPALSRRQSEENKAHEPERVNVRPPKVSCAHIGDVWVSWRLGASCCEPSNHMARFAAWIFKSRIVMLCANSKQASLCTLRRGWNSFYFPGPNRLRFLFRSFPGLNYIIHLICSNFLLLFSLSPQPSAVQAHPYGFYFVKCWCFIGPSVLFLLLIWYSYLITNSS